MKEMTKKFHAKTLNVGLNDGGPGEFRYEAVEASDIKAWVEQNKSIAIDNVVFLVNRYLKDHTFSDRMKDDFNKMNDPKTPADKVEELEQAIDDVYRLDWSIPLGSKKSKWGELAPYIPIARKRLGSNASDSDLIREANTIKSLLD